MEITYLVEPLGALDIELDSAEFLAQYQPEVLRGDEKPLDVYKLLDDIYEDKDACLQLIEDDNFPTGILGVAEMDHNIIKIRNSDYEKCDTEGYPRMTVTHEVGHPRLHLEQFRENGMKMYRTQSNKIPPYMSSEWQARVWGSATMMPFPAMVRLLEKADHKTDMEIESAIMDRFVVTQSAAHARFETMKRYVKDGRYEKIEKEMKEKGFM